MSNSVIKFKTSPLMQAKGETKINNAKILLMTVQGIDSYLQALQSRPLTPLEWQNLTNLMSVHRVISVGWAKELLQIDNLPPDEPKQGA